MKINFLQPIFFIAFIVLLAVVQARITFSCKKFKTKAQDVRFDCVKGHLKDFFPKSQMTEKNQDYECCSLYVQTICDNKIFLKCRDGDKEEDFDKYGFCQPPEKYPCIKYDKNDWGEQDPKAKPKKESKKNSKSNESAAALAKGKSVDTKTQHSGVGLRTAHLCIFSLLVYFV